MLGGDPASADDHVIPVEDRALPRSDRPLRFVELGDDAGVMGAAALARDTFAKE